MGMSNYYKGKLGYVPPAEPEEPVKEKPVELPNAEPEEKTEEPTIVAEEKG